LSWNVLRDGKKNLRRHSKKLHCWAGQNPFQDVEIVDRSRNGNPILKEALPLFRNARSKLGWIARTAGWIYMIVNTEKKKVQKSTAPQQFFHFPNRAALISQPITFSLQTANRAENPIVKKSPTQRRNQAIPHHLIT
jgi:hypothetical protein